MLIRWEQHDLAERSGLSLPTIKRIETKPGPASAYDTTLAAIRSTLKLAGVVFIKQNGPGVRLRDMENTG